MTNFEDIANSLKGLPPTFYPPLLRDLVEAAYKADVFLPGGASTLVKAFEKLRGWEWDGTDAFEDY